MRKTQDKETTRKQESCELDSQPLHKHFDHLLCVRHYRKHRNCKGRITQSSSSRHSQTRRGKDMSATECQVPRQMYKLRCCCRWMVNSPWSGFLRGGTGKRSQKRWVQQSLESCEGVQGQGEQAERHEAARHIKELQVVKSWGEECAPVGGSEG